MLSLIEYRSTSNIIKFSFRNNFLFSQFSKKIFTPKYQSDKSQKQSQPIKRLNFHQHKKFCTISEINKTLQMEKENKQTIQNQSKQQLEDQQILQNPIEQYGDDLVEQLITSEKPNQEIQTHKSRGIKRKQKLQKLRAQLKDPQLRKQRNRQRHRKQKEKLQKNLEGKTEEEIRQFLDNRKHAKKDLKQRVKKEVDAQIGLPFLIDIAYEHKMNEKENKSLATQIELIVKTLKTIQPAPNVHLCGLKEQGQVKQQLIKMKYEYWPIKAYKDSLGECLKMQKFKNKNFYYLSPDAVKTVDNIEENDIFVIGGLVDRTVIKYASLNRAQELGIEARSLPIRPFMKQRTCLNLDHIVAIVCKFMEVKDWKVAFDHGAPKRWKKEEGQKGFKEPKTEKPIQSKPIVNQESQINQTNQLQAQNQKMNVKQ